MLGKNLFVCVCVLAVCAVAASQASATVVLYSSEAAFDAHLTGATTITDWGFTSASQSLGGDVTLQNVEFLSAASYQVGSNNGLNGRCGDLQCLEAADNGIWYVYPDAASHGKSAVGVNLFGTGDAKNITGTIYSYPEVGEDWVITPLSLSTSSTSTTPVFLGVTSDVGGIYQIHLDASGSTNTQPAIGKFVMGTYLVPEPSAIAIVVTGLIGLLAYAWRRRK